MNLILLFKDDFEGPDFVILKGRRMAHLRDVNRIKPGDRLKVGLINGPMGEGSVQSISKDSIGLHVILDTEPPPFPPLTLLLALPRPKMLRRILHSVSSLGVKDIYLINTWRVEKSYWGSPLLAPQSLQSELILGLEQARDTIMPRIHMQQLFMSFIDDDLPMLTDRKPAPLLLTAHPGKGSVPCPVNVGRETILAMGPEGGFIDREVKTLERSGFETVHLGQRILRLETAVPYIISKLY
ncbi:MAG: 16S rRNA (uracil(1498)-N(3))-methyltransferase [Desulfamplus sp.]|nr:16S rRNA (uracil(1498)-N(3))-methyltransferase [Desulfamplus sp.]